MRRVIPLAAVLAVLVGLIASASAIGLGKPTPTTPAVATPRWVTHVARYPGGISNGVRAVYATQTARAGTPAKAPAGPASPANDHGGNVQMNTDSYPPMPQNETAVAYKTTNPDVAVAAANDYITGGVIVMRTSDAGEHWATNFISPQFFGTRDFCTGGDPGVAYSRRDGAFLISQLCFFRALPFSEIHVYKSVDNG